MLCHGIEVDSLGIHFYYLKSSGAVVVDNVTSSTHTASVSTLWNVKPIGHYDTTIKHAAQVSVTITAKLKSEKSNQYSGKVFEFRCSRPSSLLVSIVIVSCLYHNMVVGGKIFFQWKVTC